MKTVKSQFKFKGGVHPDYNKELARNQPIEKLATPAELVISMSQHLGAPAKCLVKVGVYSKNGFLFDGLSRTYSLQQDGIVAQTSQEE